MGSTGEQPVVFSNSPSKTDCRLSGCVDLPVLFTTGGCAVLLGPDATWRGLELLDKSLVELVIRVMIKQRGQERRLVFPPHDSGAPLRFDRKLIELIAKAHEAFDQLAEQEGEITSAERPQLTRVARLRFLAPDVTGAILAGRQPADLCARKLLRVPQLPLSWPGQRHALGFAARLPVAKAP
jgi:hypothetical protein